MSAESFYPKHLPFPLMYTFFITTDSSKGYAPNVVFTQMEWRKILHKRSFTIHILDICLQIIVKSYCGCHLTEPGSSSLLYSVYFNATGSDTLAPFTMLFGCGDPAPVLRLRLCVNLSERRGVKFYSSPDTPLEVASEALMAELCSTGNFPRWMRGSATCY